MKAVIARLHRQTLIVAGVALVLLIVVAVALGTGWASASSRADEQSQRADKREGQVMSLKYDLSVANGTIKTIQDEADKTQKDLEQLDSDKAELAKQKAAFEKQQEVVASSQLEDGVHVVGTDTAAGVYSIKSSEQCYYAWKTSTAADSTIRDNNIVSGPATVTLRAGDIFETNRCGTWSKVG